MANTTVKGALHIHGQNPQFLVEKVIRTRIWESEYWKEQCFALTAESLIDKALELNTIGGVYGNQRPTHFICLLLKLLQIQPEKEILIEYLMADEFKYLRALAALYIRMTFPPVEVFELLEPLLKDYRKLRLRNMGGYQLTYMDEFVDQLLTEERACDTILPRLTKREVLEETEGLAPRSSALLDAMAGNASGSEDEDGEKKRQIREVTLPRTVFVPCWIGIRAFVKVKVKVSLCGRKRTLCVQKSISLPFPFPFSLWLSSSSPFTNPLAISLSLSFKKHISRQDGNRRMMFCSLHTITIGLYIHMMHRHKS
ncbi:Pre-mRNA-splicing factor 38A [Ceratobasidium sp. 370]|nr:Pre-mRNA-splicing factor 38A [Ceratobasidium sp. 370]